MKWLIIVILSIMLCGCATETEFYYMVDELQYSKDNRRYEDKYGVDREVEKDKRPFPYENKNEKDL